MLTSTSSNLADTANTSVDANFTQAVESTEINRKIQLLRVITAIQIILTSLAIVVEILADIALHEFDPNSIVAVLAVVTYVVCYRIAATHYSLASKLVVGTCTFVIVVVYVISGTAMPLVFLILPIALSINLLSTRSSLAIITVCVLTGLLTIIFQDLVKSYHPIAAIDPDNIWWLHLFFIAVIVPALIALVWLPSRKQAQTLFEQNNQLRAVLDQLQFRQEANQQISQEVLQLSQTLKVNASLQADSSLTQVSLVTQLTSSTTEFSEVAGQIASATQHFSGTIETVTTGTQEIEQTANQAVEQSQEGMIAVNRTQEASREVGQFYQALLNSLASLTEQSNNMRTILSLVRSLAQETHLLSLNAAIEAVGAGEHGERFNIIAQEVKSLADRSNQANQEVIGIVSELETGIQQAAKLAEEGYAKAALMEQSVGDAGKAIGIMQDIIERTQNQVLEINQKMLSARDQINTIRVATGQQQTTTRQVLQTLQTLHLVAEQVAEGSQLVSRSALSLENTSQGLSPAYN